VNRATLVFASLLGIDAGGVAQVADHLIDVVFERRDLSRVSTVMERREVTGCNRGCNFGDGAICVVSVVARRFTLSVRSRQVPAAPGTLAWPPSFPSMPTSRRQMSPGSAKVASVGSCVDVSASSAISPFASRTASASGFVGYGVQPGNARTWLVRFSAIELTLSVSPSGARHAANIGLPAQLPSVPTSRATRDFRAKELSWSP